jgi:glycerol transport system substrate-binding protein
MLGGIITFYRSPDEKLYTDSGPNVPHYPLLAEQWWQYVSMAVTGELTAQEAMDQLAAKMDQLMGRLRLPNKSPELNEERDEEYWLSQPGSPKPEIKERPQPETIKYDELIKRWKD